jgi:hypothetical protein
MATSKYLQDKYPGWTEGDWKRFYWLNARDSRARNLAKLKTCKRCGGTPLFVEDRSDLPYHNLYHLGCRRCHSYAETTFNIRSVIIACDVRFCVVANRIPLQIVGEWNKRNSLP